MRERYILVAYACWVLLLGVLHHEALMLFSIVAVAGFGGAVRWRILSRSALAIVVFSIPVSLAYLLMGMFVPIHPEALILINLRALAITQATFTLVALVNLHHALSFNATLGMLYGLTYAQIVLLRGMLLDYYDGLRSRSATMRSAVKTTQLKPLFTTLFATMLRRSEEQGMGMRSRGLIDD
jgi:cobalt/nickel transport system permease protein